MKPTTIIRATGWQPDKPDPRDRSVTESEIANLLIQGQLDDPVSIDGNVSADLREHFSPVEHQLTLQSCTANAAVGLIEYFQRRILGDHRNVSRLFLYKMSRQLMIEDKVLFVGDNPDTGASNRYTMKAIQKYGVPPNELWEYTDDKSRFDLDPPPAAGQFARDYQNIKYYRLDEGHQSYEDNKNLKIQICSNLVFGFPCMFGFSMFESISQADSTGLIPFPADSGDSYVSGHSVLAVGFDNNLVIENELGGPPSTGAFLVRNSWGKEWGQDGYGWLPYDYVFESLTSDWWSVVNSDWIEKGSFLADRTPPSNGKSQRSV